MEMDVGARLRTYRAEVVQPNGKLVVGFLLDLQHHSVTVTVRDLDTVVVEVTYRGVRRRAGYTSITHRDYERTARSQLYLYLGLPPSSDALLQNRGHCPVSVLCTVS